jgi:hypothetical protein
MRAEILCELFDLSPIDPADPAEAADSDEARESQQALDRAIAEPALSERKAAT